MEGVFFLAIWRSATTSDCHCNTLSCHAIYNMLVLFIWSSDNWILFTRKSIHIPFCFLTIWVMGFIGVVKILSTKMPSLKLFLFSLILIDNTKTADFYWVLMLFRDKYFTYNITMNFFCWNQCCKYCNFVDVFSCTWHLLQSGYKWRHQGGKMAVFVTRLFWLYSG